MAKTSAINSNPQEKKQQIVDSALNDVENFRINATKSYSNFTLSERNQLNILDAGDISSHEVLLKWQEELRPMQNSLKDKQSDTKLNKIIINNLLLKSDEAQFLINEIFMKRQSEILHDFIYKIYPSIKVRNRDIHAKQREQAKHLLSKPESEIIILKNHQDNYLLYKEIAQQNNISVIDPYASMFKRIKCSKHINKERKNTIKYENERLSYINKNLEILSTVNNGLVVEVFDNKIDLITIFDLRHQYEKKISKLSTNDKINAVKYLAIFDTVTKKYKDEQTEVLALDSKQVSLETTRSIAKCIDTLLLRIFDLSNAQKNQLLLYSKDYRELKQEQALIEKRQKNRIACNV